MDDREEFPFTPGSVGTDLILSGNKSSDQTLIKANAAIAKNCHSKFDAENGGDAGDDWKKGLEG